MQTLWSLKLAKRRDTEGKKGRDKNEGVENEGNREWKGDNRQKERERNKHSRP